MKSVKQFLAHNEPYPKLVFVASIVLIAAMLFGCTPKATEAPTEAAPPKEAPTEAAPPEKAPTEAAPTEEPPAPEETTITMLIPDDPAGFNGLLTDSGYEQFIGELVLMSVSEIDPQGNIYPELAVEIPTIENGGVVLDEDTWSMEVTWKIRDDVYWADGEQLTVDDIIFTWNAIIDPELGSWTDGMEYTESLEKIDDFTFVVHYYEGSVYTNYRVQFGGENFNVFPEHYCDASQGFYEWDCNRQILSSGPFMLEVWEHNDHLIFVRNPNYVDADKVSIDKVIVRIMPEQSVRKTLMLEGDADFHMWPGDAAMEEYIAANNTQLLVAPSERWVMRLHLNGAAYGETDPVKHPHPFLSDVRVRQALRAAIDVDTLVEDIFLGHGRPIWTEFFREPYVCDIPRPAHDPEAAKALLEDAGWTDTDGDGVRECHGCPNAEEGALMSLDLTIYAEYGEELELAQQLVAEDWNAIGIEVELFTVEGAVLWEWDGPEDMGFFDVDMWDDGYPGIDPTDNQFWFYYSTDASVPGEGWNIMRWQNEDFENLLWETYTLDEEYRKGVFCEMAKILDEEVPRILLFSTLEAHGVSARLQGVLPSANDVATWNVTDWSVEE